MMPSNKTVKQLAKKCLKPIWACAVLVFVILSAALVFGICTAEILAAVLPGWAIILFYVLFFVLMFAPLFLGAVLWLWRVTSMPNASIAEIFLPFSSVSAYIKNLSFVVIATFKAFCAYVICLLPYFAAHMGAAGRIFGNTPGFAVSALAVESVFEFVGIIAFLYILLRHYLAPFIFMAGVGMTANEAIYLSRKISKDSFFPFCLLFLSLIGWLALSLLALPVFYTLPYMAVCFTVHSRFAINEYNKKLRTQDKEWSYSPFEQNIGGEE